MRCRGPRAQAYRCAAAADRTGHAMLHTLYGMSMKHNCQFFGGLLALALVLCLVLCLAAALARAAGAAPRCWCRAGLCGGGGCRRAGAAA
jgi:succinate dehydrogenase (ubiquinone) flavoprotein subunit